MTETLETIRYTADVVVTTTDGHVLLIERGWDPHKGQWALPGGHVDPGETSRAAAARELAEEAGVYATPDELGQVGEQDREDEGGQNPDQGLLHSSALQGLGGEWDWSVVPRARFDRAPSRRECRG